MITLEKAIEIAKEYYINRGSPDITYVAEAEGVWIVNGGIKGVRRVGSFGITINKDNGEIRNLILPSKEGFALLDSAKKIDLDYL